VHRPTFAGSIAALGAAALLACGTGGGRGGSDLPSQSSSQPAWRVRDTGLRCVTHPCFSLEAAPLAGGAPEPVSDLDLDALDLSAAGRDSVLAAVRGEGVSLRGVIEIVPEAGPAGDARVLRASALVPAR
jgi:hypothetical protein